MKYKDYYEILGVYKKTSKEDIKIAYRKLAKKYHPDNNNGDKEAEIKFKDLNEAYNTLCDNEAKKKYDRVTAKYRYGIEPNTNNNLSDVTYEVKKGKNAINDFFNILLGLKKQDNADGNVKALEKENRPIKGENEETEIQITLEEAFFGGEKKIAIKTLDQVKTYTAEIPVGIKDSEKVRLAGVGKIGRNGGKNGDLIITVKVLKHKDYILDGIDLIKDIHISPWQAALGADIMVSTIDGELKVKVPEAAQADNRIKVSNRGFRYNENTRGNLILIIKVDVPRNITQKQKELYSELKECEA
ncbi:MAG: J domain-containing protein [Clostridia bacterium]